MNGPPPAVAPFVAGLSMSLAELAAPVFESVSDAILVCDGDTMCILMANRAATTLYGYAPEELRGMPIPQLSLEPAKTVRHVRSALLHGNTSRETRRHRHKNGNALVIEVSATVFTWQGRRLLLAVVHDVSERASIEQALAESEARLREHATQLELALMGTVTSIAKMIELRDPYTAGHERRVAVLAEDLALELGMGAEAAKGLHVIGLMHDIGKIAVPAEILSFPGRLSPPQFSLVQEHAQRGYEVLRGIPFPWPVADAVLQHHERLDGSGYPNGLRGDAIILEARVIAVADVVEAMSSHRPYRSALGIDRGLAEIEAKSGVLYDPAVAAACARLLRNEEYRREWSAIP